MALQRITTSDTSVVADLSSGLGADWAIKLDGFGNQKMVQDVSLFHGMFSDGISSKMWKLWVDDVLQEESENITDRAESKYGGGFFQDSSTQGSSVRVESREYSRYQPNRSIHYATAGAIPSHTAQGHIRRWGLGTEENGFFFEIAEDGIMYTVIRNNTKQKYTTTSDTTSFVYDEEGLSAGDTVYIRAKGSGDMLWQDVSDTITGVDNSTDTITVSPAIASGTEVVITVVTDEKNEITQNLLSEGIDPSKECLYDIVAGWRGAADVEFYVRSANASGVKLGVNASYSNLGISERPSVANPSMPSFFEVKNVSAISPAGMLMGCVDQSSSGGSRRDDLQYTSTSNPNQPEVEVGDVTDDEVFTLIVHNPVYYRGQLNTRDVHLQRIGGYSLDSTIMNIYVTTDPQFVSGGLQLEAVNSGSCLFVDKNLNADGTAFRGDQIDISTLQPVLRGRVPAQGTFEADQPTPETSFVIKRGQYLVVTMQLAAGKSGTTVAASTVEVGEGI